MKHLFAAIFFFTLAWLNFPGMSNNAAIEAKNMEAAAEYARLGNIPLYEMSPEMAAKALQKARLERIIEQAVARMKSSGRGAAAAPRSLFPVNSHYQNTITDGLYRTFSSTGEVLGTITSIESASSALQSLEEASNEVDYLFNKVNRMPSRAQKSIPGIVSVGMSTLEPLIKKANAVPGVDDVIGGVLTPMLNKLEKMGG